MKRLLILCAAAVAVIAGAWLGRSPAPTELAEPWMSRADLNGDGRLSSEEYDRVSDGLTPLAVLDLDESQDIDARELHLFMKNADPLRWLNP
jgi:hypothetical protein